MKRRDVIRHLLAQGCVWVREGGRHSVYRSPSGRQSAVPRHAEIQDNLVKVICKQLTILAPGEEPDPDAMAELVDRLVLRLGPGRVFRRSPVESEWPERAVRRVAPLSPATGVTWPADLPRPGRLLPVPCSTGCAASSPRGARRGGPGTAAP